MSLSLERERERGTERGNREERERGTERREREREREISIGTLGYMEDLLQMYDTGLHRANKFFTMNELITCHIINKEMAKMIRIRHTPQPGSSPTSILYCVESSSFEFRFI